MGQFEDELKQMHMDEGGTQESWDAAIAASARRIREIGDALIAAGWVDGDERMHIHHASEKLTAAQIFDWLDGQPLGRPCWIIDERADGTYKIYKMIMPKPSS